MQFVEETNNKGESQGHYKIFDFEDWDCFKGWYDQKKGTASVNIFNGEDWTWYNFEGISSEEMLLEKLNELENREKQNIQCLSRSPYLLESNIGK